MAHVVEKWKSKTTTRTAAAYGGNGTDGQTCL
jgi:hypothetical protein